ncbi:response regulator aspartate phosphatase C [Terribacillus aidingensis]|uniref:Response regulator aspartate phosphatase C n=1 Tax=Terribacillus aidingensis TaxID=586416 RepID=A0A285N3G7_9BACI|nr:tetratricopeptide repeat protein [Terribacillus aidingensis]SNZ03483.1 response regulator aspartate phosphatase C [Terribacillus aidingensis]
MHQTDLKQTEMFTLLLDNLYENIKSEQIKAAEHVRFKIAEQEMVIRDEKLLARSMLYEARLETLKGNLEKGGQLLEGVTDAFALTSENLYYYHFFKGLLLYRQSKLQEAIIEYERAESFLTGQIDHREVSDFYYKLANTYYHMNMTAFSILNADKAIESALRYKQDLQVAKCRLLQGLNYMEAANFRKAEELFQAALEHDASQSELKLPLYVHHNLGVLYFKKNQLEKAIFHMEQSMGYKHPDYYIKSLYYVTECSFRLGLKERAMQYFAEGFTLSKERDDDAYKWMFAMLHKQYVDQDSLEGVWREGIEYFQSIQDSNKVRHFAERFAKYYTDHRDFEKASRYYLLALK